MAEMARVRRAVVKAGVGDTAVQVNGVGRYPNREFIESTRITTIDALARCTKDDLTAAMTAHNKTWTEEGRLRVGIVQMKNLYEIAFRCRELIFQNDTFDPDDLTNDAWQKLRVRIDFHEANKNKEEPKAPKFPKEIQHYWEWLEEFEVALKLYYCPEGLCTLNALNKDPDFDLVNCTNEMAKRDHLCLLTGAVYDMLSAKLFLFLSKCTKNSPAQAFVDDFLDNRAGLEALSCVKAHFEQTPQVRARRSQLTLELKQIIFRGDGSSEISEYTSQLTSQFKKLAVVRKTYTDDEKVNDHLLAQIQTESRAAADVAAVKSSCRQQFTDDFAQACIFINGQIGPICPKTKTVAGKSKRQISQAATMQIRHHKVPLDGRVPNAMWNDLTESEKARVERVRSPPSGGRGRGRGGGRGGRGRGNWQRNQSHGRGYGGRGGYYNNNGGRGYGRGRGNDGRGGRGGRHGNWNNNNNGNWNNGGNGNWNNDNQNESDQRQVNAANANRNGTETGNQPNNAGNGQNSGDRPDNAQSSGNGNKGGQAGNAFGRGAYPRGPP